MTEAPVGDKEIEPEAPEGGSDAMRADEALLDRQGRTAYHTVALDAAGDVVAFSDLGTTIHDPGVVYQWGTLACAATPAATGSGSPSRPPTCS